MNAVARAIFRAMFPVIVSLTVFGHYPVVMVARAPQGVIVYTANGSHDELRPSFLLNDVRTGGLAAVNRQ